MLLVIGLILINIGVLLFILPWFLKRFRYAFKTAAIVLAVIGVLAIFSGYYINYRTHRYHKAVMISKKATVKRKPVGQSTIVNKAYRGYILTVDKQRSRGHKGWYYVRMSNGQYGWIQADQIKIL